MDASLKTVQNVVTSVLPTKVQAQLASTLEQLKPAVEPVWNQISLACAALYDRGRATLGLLEQRGNAYLQPWDPVHLVLASCLGTAAALLLVIWISSACSRIRAQGLMQWLFAKLRKLPFISGLVSKGELH